MYADLHIHTNFSDGIYSPKEILIKAEKAKDQTVKKDDFGTAVTKSIKTRAVNQGFEEGE